MKISAKTDYACKALLELAIHWPNVEPLNMNEIAKKQKIPLNFLNQILLNLRQFGYVQSVRGKKGGYLLLKSPKEITLKDVLNDFNDLNQGASSGVKNDSTKEVIQKVWDQAQHILSEYLAGITFEALAVEREELKNIRMYTI